MKRAPFIPVSFTLFINLLELKPCQIHLISNVFGSRTHDRYSVCFSLIKLSKCANGDLKTVLEQTQWGLLLHVKSTSINLYNFCVILTSIRNNEKAMAPHSSTLAWKIPWMEEPGRLQSMGPLRVGHD